MLAIDEPNRSATARSGALVAAAVTSVTASGSDAAIARNRGPMKSRPSPVSCARRSPAVASALPAHTNPAAPMPKATPHCHSARSGIIALVSPCHRASSHDREDPQDRHSEDEHGRQQDLVASLGLHR
jgi:hypothetical protein